MLDVKNFIIKVLRYYGITKYICNSLEFLHIDLNNLKDYTLIIFINVKNEFFYL